MVLVLQSQGGAADQRRFPSSGEGRVSDAQGRRRQVSSKGHAAHVLDSRCKTCGLRPPRDSFVWYQGRQQQKRPEIDSLRECKAQRFLSRSFAASTLPKSSWWATSRSGKRVWSAGKKPWRNSTEKRWRHRRSPYFKRTGARKSPVGVGVASVVGGGGRGGGHATRARVDGRC